jgi:multidrug efflux pump subunit AcrA (membrane-fusion protein)
MNAFVLALVYAGFAQLTADVPAAAPAPESAAPAPPVERAPYPVASQTPMGFRKTPEGDPVLMATIKADNDVPISAEAEGTLIKIPVREGSQVAAGQVLATIDDRQAQAGVEVAKYGLEAAEQRAKDNIEERYAVAAAKVAYVDWKRDVEANQRTPNAVADIQVMQKRLVYDRSVLQTEKAQKDQVLAMKEADVKRAELKAANILLNQRQIRAPFAGEVVELAPREGQWVKPGDAILRLVQFDKLRVEGFVPAAEYDPVDLANRRVTVIAHLARGRQASVEGRIVFVDQTVVMKWYRVRAEIENQREGDFWLLRPGLDAEITIHASQPPVDVTEPKTAQK